MAKWPNRRKRILIDEMQYRMLVVNIAYFFVILVVFLTSLFASPVALLLGSNGSPWHQQRAAQQFLVLDETIWLPVLLTFFCLTLHSVFVSHRIAGPRVQFRRLLGAVGGGDLTVRSVLRKKDYLRADAAALNDMVDKVGRRLGAIEDHAGTLQQRLGWLRTAVVTGSQGEVLDQLRGLDEEAAALDCVLHRFTLPRDRASGEPLRLVSNSR